MDEWYKSSTINIKLYINKLNLRNKIIIIKTTDGKEFSKSVAIQNWHPTKPISNTEVEEKFRYCADNSKLPQQNVEKIIEIIWNLEECNDTNALTSLCTF